MDRTHEHPETVTGLLEAVQAGERGAFDRLFPLVYDELHGLARRQRLRWHGDYTVNTTALVHEAYLKMVDPGGGDQGAAGWESRAHFMAVAARAMRHILVDYARRRSAQKRGGDYERLSLDDDVVLSEERAEELVCLDEALARLAEVSERQSRVVECRFFGGMTIEDTAAVLDVSTPTVKRDWRVAQAWLYRELQRTLEL